MLKIELERKVEELREEVENLQNELDSLNAAYGELAEKNYELSNDKSAVGIKDLNNFKFYLRSENLLTDEL